MIYIIYSIHTLQYSIYSIDNMIRSTNNMIRSTYGNITVWGAVNKDLLLRRFQLKNEN